MKLYIAEKPSLGREIAKQLGNGEFRDGKYIIGSDWCVTWCFGHMYENYSPEEYDESYRYWNLESLPIIPEVWRIKAKKDCLDQINTIRNLMDLASVVVNCGDPDREGQLLVDELIRELCWAGDTERAWIQDLSEKGLKKSLSNLKPNSNYKDFSDSALARSQSDWLIGMNMTRAYSVQAQRIGFKGVLSVGRVQTPTLNMIVTRDLEIEDFKPYEFYVIEGRFKHGDEEFSASWKIPEDHLNADGKCVNKQIIDEYLNQFSSCNTVEVKSFVSQEKKKLAPLPFSLSGLQSYCSEKYGYSASLVLDIAQSLYERHKLITYPRTDCGYLSEGQWDDVLNILGMVCKWVVVSDDIDLDINTPGRCFNDKKITAHTGIIPTGEAPKGLSIDEKNVFDAINRRLLMQFVGPYRFSESKAELSVDMEIFIAKGKVVIDEGWGKLEPSKNQSKGALLPDLKDVDKVNSLEFNPLTKTTTPPKRFTEGTLIKAMVNIGRYLSEQADKDILRQTEGIGTEATRAGIIENLKSKQFIEKKGKSLISTPLGRKMVSIVYESVKSPVLTAEWEKKLKQLEQGSIGIDQFMSDQEKWLRNVLIHANKADLSAFGGKKCPKCDSGYLVEKKGKYGLFIGCSNYPGCTYILKTNKARGRKRRKVKHG